MCVQANPENPAIPDPKAHRAPLDNRERTDHQEVLDHPGQRDKEVQRHKQISTRLSFETSEQLFLVVVVAPPFSRKAAPATSIMRALWLHIHFLWQYHFGVFQVRLVTMAIPDRRARPVRPDPPASRVSVRPTAPLTVAYSLLTKTQVERSVSSAGHFVLLWAFIISNPTFRPSHAPPPNDTLFVCFTCM